MKAVHLSGVFSAIGLAALMPVLLVLGTLPSPAHAQTDAGSLRVLVVDDSQAVVPGVEVTATQVGTNVGTTRITDNEGYATFVPMLRGTYDVSVSLPGFADTTVRNVGIDVAERRLIRVVLKVAAVTEVIEVAAGLAPIQTEDASLGQVVKGDVAVELPLAGRRYSELALLAPGATRSTLNPVTRGPGWFVANGNYHTQNNFILDGFDNNQGTQNAQALSAQVVQPSPDAISEFKVQTNSYSAEFGRSAGAVVNVSLKSGANDVHGSAWYYNRDSALAANSWRGNLIGTPKDELKWHQFGATIGGPIKRDKLFYFGHYEGFRRSFSDLFLVNVPTLDQRQGIFNFDVRDPVTGQPFPNRTIPADRFNPQGKKIIDLYPQPNLPGRVVSSGQTVENFGAQRDGKEDAHKFDIRSDYYHSADDRFFFRYSFLEQDIFRDPIFEGPGDGVGNQGQQFNRNHSFGASWNRTISPTVINEFRFGHNRTASSFSHATAGGMTGTEFGFVGIPAELDAVGGLPRMEMSNYNDLGTRNFRPQYQDPISYQIMNNLSMVRGQHSLKFGFELRHKNNEFIDVTRRTPNYRFRGRFTGDAIGDLLIGHPDRLQLNTVPVVEQLQQAWSWFMQDDWKVTPNLTLNLGLRYEYTTPYYGAAPNRNINFDFQTGQLVFASDSDKYLVDRDRNNFGPRLGLAYQIQPDRLVLRAGYGVFYSGEDIFGSEANLPLNPPQLIQPNLDQIGSGPPPLLLSDPIPSGVLTEFDSRTIQLRTRERGFWAATVHQWNVALQFLLPMDSNLELAYVGNVGRNLFSLFQGNQTPFGVDGSVAANRPFPEWAQIQVGATRAQSNYNAFQTRFEKRYTQGWYLLTSYTYASALDEAGAWSESSSPQILDNFKLERGPMTQTSRHRLSVANVWQLPLGRGRAWGGDMSRVLDFFIGGWQMSNIVTAQSGLPVNVSLTSSGINPHTGQSYTFMSRNGGALRPNRVGNGNTGVAPKIDRFNFLNVDAYQVQTLNTAGSASRNSAWGPNFVNFDISIVKRFRVDEQRSFDYRLEMFNMFNQVNFRQPNGTFGGSSFGIISDAFEPRIIQMAIRFQF